MKIGYDHKSCEVGFSLLGTLALLAVTSVAILYSGKWITLVSAAQKHTQLNGELEMLRRTLYDIDCELTFPETPGESCKESTYIPLYKPGGDVFVTGSHTGSRIGVWSVRAFCRFNEPGDDENFLRVEYSYLGADNVAIKNPLTNKVSSWRNIFSEDLLCKERFRADSHSRYAGFTISRQGHVFGPGIELARNENKLIFTSEFTAASDLVRIDTYLSLIGARGLNGYTALELRWQDKTLGAAGIQQISRIFAVDANETVAAGLNGSNHIDVIAGHDIRLEFYIRTSAGLERGRYGGIMNVSRYDFYK
jgi:hypothetical protein